MTYNPKNKIDPRDLMPFDQKCEMWLELHSSQSQVRVLNDRIEYLQYRLKSDDENFDSIDFEEIYRSKEREEFFR
jgi:hypothetical protein